LGIDPPPLEEFKRLMESLGDTASMFEEDGFFGEGGSGEEGPGSMGPYGDSSPPRYEDRISQPPRLRKTQKQVPMNATEVRNTDSAEDDEDVLISKLHGLADEFEVDVDALRSPERSIC